MSNKYQIGFRNDMLSTVFAISGKTWGKFTIIYLIQTIISIVIIGGGFLAFGFLNMFKDFGSITNPNEILGMYQELLGAMLSSPAFIAFIGVAVIVMFVVSAWMYNLGFMLTQDEIKSGKIDFKESLVKSFSPEVFRIALLTLILSIVTVSGVGIAALSMQVSGFFTFLMLLVWAIFMCRFILILPALILGRMSITDSFSFSFKHISNIRALKLFGVLILAMLALIVAALVIGLITGLLSLIPYLGVVIRVFIQIVFGGYMMALVVSLLAGMYYRYAEDIVESEEIDVNNLIIND